MAGNSRQMQDHEARTLLNLKGTRKLDAARIEQSYKAAISVWSRKIVDPLVGHKDRDRANDMLKLLMQAKEILLSSATASTVSRSDKTVQSSAGSYNQPVPHCHTPMPSSTSIRKAFGHVGMVFTHLFKSGVELFRFACAVPPMCSEIKDFADWVLDHASNVGIPKIIVIFVVILGAFALFQGCSEVFGKVSHYFKK